MWNPFSSNALSTLGKASKNAGRQIHGFPLAAFLGTTMVAWRSLINTNYYES